MAKQEVPKLLTSQAVYSWAKSLPGSPRVIVTVKEELKEVTISYHKQHRRFFERDGGSHLQQAMPVGVRLVLKRVSHERLRDHYDD